MEPEESQAEEAQTSAMFLQIGGRAEADPPLEVPVRVQNLDGEVVTLEINQNLPGLKGDELPGRPGKLRLTLEGGSERVAAGTIVWAYFSGESRRQLFLGLELPDIEAAVERALLAQLGHPSGDIRDLWNRWDQVHLEVKASATPKFTYVVGGAVIVTGFALQYAGRNMLGMLGYMFMVVSSMVLAARICGLWGKQG